MLFFETEGCISFNVFVKSFDYIARRSVLCIVKIFSEGISLSGAIATSLTTAVKSAEE
jgi:hypothetical protein